MLRNRTLQARGHKKTLGVLVVVGLLFGSASVAQADGELLQQRSRPTPPSGPRLAAPSPSHGSGDIVPIQPPRPRPIKGPRVPGQETPVGDGIASRDDGTNWLRDLLRSLHLFEAGR